MTNEDVKETPPPCPDGMHIFPDADFEVGARVCLMCGAKEY